MSKFLIDESPLKLSPSLSAKIGESAALIVQQLHHQIFYKNTVMRDGEHWHFTSIKRFHEQFPFMHEDHLKRILAKLNKQKLIITKKNGNLGTFYRLNYENIAKEGFICNKDNITSGNEIMIIVLPSLAFEFGLPSAIILQQIYYLINVWPYIKGNIDKAPQILTWLKWGQITYKKAKEWIPFIKNRQLVNIFINLESNNLIVPELPFQDDRNSGKWYKINYEEIHLRLKGPITNVLVDNLIPMTIDSVDKNILRGQNCITSGDKIASPPVTKLHHLSIDQDHERSFKKTILIPRGVDQNYGTIPKAKVDFVCLKDRLITYGFLSEVADRRIDEYGETEIESKIEVLLMTYKKEEKLNPKLITSSLKENYQLKKSGGSMNLQTVKSEDSKMKKHGDKERIEYFAKVDSVVVSTIEVGESAIAKLRAANKPPPINHQVNRFS